MSRSLLNFNAYLIDSFQLRFKTDKNPIPFDPNHHQYYELERNTLEAHKTKRFKIKGQSAPEECLLEPESDAKVREKSKQKSMNKPNFSPEDILKNFKQDPSNPSGIEVPEAFKKAEQNFKDQNTKSQSQEKGPKKVLIEEISSTVNEEDVSQFNITFKEE